MEVLIKQKEFLLIKMKDYLLVNDIYNLQKIKKEYDTIQKKIKTFVNLKNDDFEIDPYSGYSMTKLNGHVNPRHLKHYKNFKNPVKDYNYLVYEKQVKENFEDLEVNSKTNFQYNPESLDKKLKMRNNLDVSKLKEILINKDHKDVKPPKKDIPTKVYNDIYGDIFIDNQDVLEYIEQEQEPSKINFKPEINQIIEEEQENFEQEYNNEYYEYT